MLSVVTSCLNAISIDRIGKHIRALEGIRHPAKDMAALERAAAYVETQLAALEYEVTDHWFTDGGRAFRNVIATRRGTQYPQERIIVVAHYDTVPVSPGADDNASGVAVLLELATVLESLRFDCTVQFAAVNLEERQRDGPIEEAALVGSRALAAYAQEQGWAIQGTIVLESVAYAGDSVAQSGPEGMPVATPEVGNYIAVIGNQHSADLVQGFVDAIGRYQAELPAESLVVPGCGEMIPDTRRSDHSSFWDRGYKAIMLSDTANFRNPHYHNMGDTFETLNLSFAAQVCRATGGLVADLAGVKPI